MKAYKLHKILIALTLTTLTFSFTSLFAFAKADYIVRDFSLGRKSWEEFKVTYTIQNTTSGNTDIKPTEYKIEMLGEDGTILKTFHNKNEFTIDDKNLGSGEKLTFKLSIFIKGNIFTAEQSAYASQKSVVLDNNVNLPLENHISVGDVKIACKLMRTKYNNVDKWETIGTFNDVAVSLFISNGNVNDYVEVPLNTKNTSFDLAQYKYYDDLKMQMERDLRKQNTALIKYYFQFVWDRNTYIVEGGSKNINVKEYENIAIVKSYSTDIQKLVTTNNYNKPIIISASAE
ncbi:MAG: hypothetical protein WCP57_06265 [Bacteroidota bacterium]